MGRGKTWTDEENSIMSDMISKGLSLEEVLSSGDFPDRTAEAIRGQFQRLGGTSGGPDFSFVEKIEPAKDALAIEKVVRLFSAAFEQVCSISKVDKLALERLRIIFQAAKDYEPLLAGYEKWNKIEKEIAELSAAVAELQAAKGTKKV